MIIKAYRVLAVISSLTLLFLLLGVALPLTVHADNASIGEACSGLNQLPDGSCDNNGSTAVSVANQGVKLLSIVAGIITIVMIIVAGFQYITAAGDSGKLGKARTALIYAIVGLIVVALAQFLVHVVLTATS